MAMKNLHLARVGDAHSSGDGSARPSASSGSASPLPSPKESACSPFSIMPFARRLSSENSETRLSSGNFENLRANDEQARSQNHSENSARSDAGDGAHGDDETAGAPCSTRGSPARDVAYQITTVNDGVFQIAHVDDCCLLSEIAEDHAMSEISRFKPASSSSRNGQIGGASEVDDSCASP